MTFTVRGTKHHRSVVFKRRVMADSDVPPTGIAKPHNSSVESERSSSGLDGDNNKKLREQMTHSFYGPTSLTASMSAATSSASPLPELFTALPPIRDFLETRTSEIQNETIQECLPYLSGLQQGVSYNDFGLPNLDRKRHIQFLHKSLKTLPASYVAADASRPWMFYWALAGLAAMGEDVTIYREKVIATVRPIQNITGGFGGGNGQMSHLAPTYAIILSLAMVGGAEALDLIDRKAIWKWLGALKQPDGGFQMSIGGEEDVRGVYCATVIITMLNLPLELPRDSPAWCEGATLLDNLPEWIGQCQTFEGGISCRPNAEAHGAYAFCALACLCILGEPHVMIPDSLDVPLLVSWLSARQYAPEGGFAGRTNKLVDGCYSHWVGGCWPLIGACLDGSSESSPKTETVLESATSVGSIYSREGLIRYILCCCQDEGKRGGLRDKPSHSSDSYHTCYVLAGLSSAQNKWSFTSTILRITDGSLTSPYQWASAPFRDRPQIYDEKDRVKPLHPIFVIPEGDAERVRAHFAVKGGF